MIQNSSALTAFSDFPIFFLSPSQFLRSGEQTKSAGATVKRSETNGSKKRRWALVVDDVSDVTEMLSVLLKLAGYDVSTASSAQDAIALAQEHHFDVIISDIGMPEMNGYELARALRQLPAYATVPMVAVTGYSLFDDRHRSLTAGFNEHVTKPIDPGAFLNLIEQL